MGDARQRQQRLKPRFYDEPVVRELSKLWELLNYSCGKRLVAIMPELIAKLEQFGELRLAPTTKRETVAHQCRDRRSPAATRMDANNSCTGVRPPAWHFAQNILELLYEKKLHVDRDLQSLRVQ